MPYCVTTQTSAVLPESWRGSTYLNSALQSYHDVAHRIKAKLGFGGAGAGGVNVEASDQQICMFIDEAIEWYTKYTGQTVEYMVFCTQDYVQGCGVKLDEYVNYQCGPRHCETTTTYDVVTSVSSTATFVGAGYGLLSSVNAPSASIVYLTYDPEYVWNFNPCDATHVLITASDVTPADSSICGPVTGLFSIVNGVVTIYPASYAALLANVCTPLSAYWGCSAVDTATHVNITNVPPCTIGGMHALTYNNGKLATIQLCNTSINTNGPLQATFQFFTSYTAPTASYLTYEIPQNGNTLRLTLTADHCLPTTSTWCSVSAQFTSVSSTSAYAVTSCTVSSWQDADLMSMRKIAEVTSLDRSGTFGGIGESYLYGLDYAIAQNLWGGTALTTNVASRGFDFVTYELLGQYIELAKRLLAREYEFRFNRDTQMLKIIPEPPTSSAGATCSGNCNNICFIVTCYIEKPIKDLIKERWILNYAMALTMIAIGHSRTKFGSVTLFGGGSVNGADMMSQGLDLKEKLEHELLQEFGEVIPPRFFIG